MKRIILFAIFVSFAIGVFLFSNDKEEEQILPAATGVVGAVDYKQLLQIKYNDIEYQVAWSSIDNNTDVKLFPNFENSQTVEDIYTNNACEIVVSGGFYTENNTPVGLFISDYETIRKSNRNFLFNGYLTINFFDTPRITPIIPTDELRLALQSGPLLIQNTEKLSLDVRNDSPARRVVAATTGKNELIFIIIYNKDSVFSGPFLNDLPEILGKVEHETELVFADAINLDGGTHSAFYTDTLKLSELSPIGSYFCIGDSGCQICYIICEGVAQ